MGFSCFASPMFIGVCVVREEFKPTLGTRFVFTDFGQLMGGLVIRVEK